jgi:hypothetical protein
LAGAQCGTEFAPNNQQPLGIGATVVIMVTLVADGLDKPFTLHRSTRVQTKF